MHTKKTVSWCGKMLSLMVDTHLAPARSAWRSISISERSSLASQIPADMAPNQHESSIMCIEHIHYTTAISQLWPPLGHFWLLVCKVAPSRRLWWHSPRFLIGCQSWWYLNAQTNYANLRLACEPRVHQLFTQLWVIYTISNAMKLMQINQSTGIILLKRIAYL